MSKIRTTVQKFLRKPIRNEQGKIVSIIDEEVEGWVPTANLRLLEEYTPPDWWVK